MYKIKLSKLHFIVLLGITACISFSCNQSTITEETVNVAYTTSTNCQCDPSWFPHSQTPPPAEGIGSPFDTSSTINCDFHQWSWQKFLYLTKNGSNGNPLFLDILKQVNNNMDTVPPMNGISLVLTDTGQASSQGVLMSNASYGNNVSNTVYYSIHANSTILTAAATYADLIILDTSDVNNKYTFPVGSFELKASWIKASAIPSTEIQNYFTTTAVISYSGEVATMALLGMHVVGVVQNHPEFIWATFEHKSMAPNYDWTNTTSTQDAPVTSTSNMLFFQAGDTSTYKDIEWNHPSPPLPQNVFSVYQHGVPILPDNSYMVTSQNGYQNFTNIDSINNCVAASLSDVWNNYFYQGSTWINMDGLTPTQQADTIYTLGGKIGHADSGNILRGSVAAFNITMETFEQVHSNLYDMDVSDLTNCLSCHSAQGSIQIGSTIFNGKSPLYISHIFRSYISAKSGVPSKEIEALRIREFLESRSKK